MPAPPARLRMAPPLRLLPCSRLLPPAAALLLALSPGLQPQPAAALLVYSASGASVDGSLGGTPFRDATWTVTATADPALVQAGLILGINPIRFLPVQPTITLQQPGSSLTARLLDADPLHWNVYSLDLSRARPELSVNGFGLLDTRDPALIPDGLPDALAVAVAAAGFNTLELPLLLFGSNDTRTNAVLTDRGPLLISMNSRGAGLFRISAVPGPLPLAGLAAALGWSRRLRQRLRRPGRLRPR